MGKLAFDGREFGCFQFSIPGTVCQVERKKISGFSEAKHVSKRSKPAESVNSPAGYG